jgi:hypothetical protein
MNPGDKKHLSFVELHGKWMENMENYIKELQQLDASARYLQQCLHDLYLQEQLSDLRNRILMQRSLISALRMEMAQLSHQMKQHDNVITVGDIMAHNKLRDKMLKAEQDVYMLKTIVHQLLSKAS